MQAMPGPHPALRMKDGPLELPPPVAAPVILDCDNTLGGRGLPGAGVDAGLALLFLLAQPSVALRGITACHGAASPAAVVQATGRLLRQSGVIAMPLMPGGAGLEPSAAARFLVQATLREPGRITILATGPLTNLAAAARMDPEFLGRCAGILCLGGGPDTAAPGRRGAREANFAADPAAARLVLAAAEARVTVLPASGLGLQLGIRDLAPLPTALRRALWPRLLVSGLGLRRPRVTPLAMLPALRLTHPSLFESRAVTLTLGDEGRLAAAAEGPHELVARLRHPEAARAVLLQALSAWC
jgi:hypothetical protein